MVGSARQVLPSCIGAATATRKMELDNNTVKEESLSKGSSKPKISDADLSFGERAFSAATAAVISSIIVNPLDVAKMLQEVKYMPSSAGTQPTCSPECTRYRGTLDVFFKVVRQEGFLRLWRGTNASGNYMPLYDIFRTYMEELMSQNAPTITPYTPLVTGSLARSVACITCYHIELARTRMQAFKHNQASAKPPGVENFDRCCLSHQDSKLPCPMVGAQLARDVPFSAVFWSLLEPLRRRILSGIADEANLPSVLGVNLCAGFVAGSIAAASTCPLDVARTRRQIEKDLIRALTMTTRQTLVEIWRDGGIIIYGGWASSCSSRSFSGDCGIVYEVVKHVLHYRQLTE